MSRVTPHQRDTLRRVARMAASRRESLDGGWVHVKDSGAPAACEHLYRKGYLARRVQFGVRGGEHRYYTPTKEGWELFNWSGR
jgi:hypothetical protein